MSPITWLKGTTTWANLATDLAKLACGEIADGSAVTCAAGDRWVRDVTRTVTDAVLNSTTTLTSATAAFTAADVGAWVIATGVPPSTSIASITNATTVVLSAAATASGSGVSARICLDTIRTPAAKDVTTGACANRTGYFSAAGIANLTNPMSAAFSTVCRVSGPFTTEPVTQTLHRWVVNVTVNTANTTPGNYSTAAVAVNIYNPDAGTSSSLGSGAPNAAGVFVAGNGLQITMSDPSGTLPVGGTFYRAFSTAYMHGIDWWPMLYRAAGATTFGTAPPGVAGTDYDIVIGTSGGTGTPHDRGGLFCGLGIKTATGLGTGALYTVNEAMALAKCRIFASATAGQLSLDVGGSRTDVAVPGTFRATGGLRITTWCRPFQTAGSVTAGAAVQYFMSVKSDGIALVLNGDAANSGKLSSAWIGAMTPIEPTYDVLPVAYNFVAPDLTIDSTDNSGQVYWSLGGQYSYWSLRRRQDGSEGARDWQTKWMRGEGLWYGATSGSSGTDITGSGIGTGLVAGQALLLTTIGAHGSTSTAPVSYPARQNKPGIDGKWWAYGYTLAEGDWQAPNQQSLGAENRIYRLTQNSRFLYLPGDGWGSGDELTDSVTGTKYLLVAPDYPGIPSRTRVAANTYFGGVAVAEV